MLCKDDRAPILRWTQKVLPSLEDYLELIGGQATMQEVFVNNVWHGSTKPTGYAPYSFLLRQLKKSHGDKLEEGGPAGGRTVLKHLARLSLVTEALNTLEDEIDDKTKMLLERYEAK